MDDDLQKARDVASRLKNMYPANSTAELARIFQVQEWAIRQVLGIMPPPPPEPEPGLTARQRSRLTRRQGRR